MSRYDFNPDRLKRAIEKIAEVLLPYGKWAEEALDDLTTDIEALHLRAQQRDHLIDAFNDLAHGSEVIYEDDIYEITDLYTDEEANLIYTPDLNL